MAGTILYKHLDNGVHQVTWQDVGQGSIAAYVKLFQDVMDAAPENSILRILHDYRQTGTPSFSAMTRGMKDLSLRDDVTLRIAHLYNDGTYPMIVKNATLVARFNANRKFFNANEEQQAIEWLIDER